MLTQAAVGLLLSLGCSAWAQSTGAEPQNTPYRQLIQAPAEAWPEFPLEQVKHGLKGYGVTVFHGTEPEAFPIEVESVEVDAEPGGWAVVWVRTEQENMVRSGPVQGMSGSPIYLWDEGEEGEVGKGGRLLGAFAYGFPNTNECLIGVQPIRYMRMTGERGHTTHDAQLKGQAVSTAAAVTPDSMGRAWRDYQEASKLAEIPDHMRARFEALGQLKIQGAALREYANRAARLSATGPKPMALPMAVGSERTAALAGPLLAPLGIATQAGSVAPMAMGRMAGGVVGVTPMLGINTQSTMKPGSTLSIPLTFGDATLAATGTTTDVLPDGTVLGFGHSMFGTGPVNMPMATGYVHFVVSLRTTSFKRSGPLQLIGSIVQDEEFAVAGLPTKNYETSPMEVSVSIEGLPDREFNYEVVHLPELSGRLASILAMQSLGAEQAPPRLNTMTIRSEISFSDGSSLKMDSIAPGGQPDAAMMAVGPFVDSLLTSPFADVRMTGAKVEIDMDREVRLSRLTKARLGLNTAQPGQRVPLHLELQRYRDTAPKPLTLWFKVPEDATPGPQPVIVGDLSTFLPIWNATHPGKLTVNSQTQLVETLQLINEFPEDAIYIALPANQPNRLTFGRASLDKLPSSRAMQVMGSASSDVVVHPGMTWKQHDFDDVVVGGFTLQLDVQDPDALEGGN